MVFRSLRIPAALACLTGLTGCGPEDARQAVPPDTSISAPPYNERTLPTDSGARTPAPSGPSDREQRPDTRQLVISIEGMDETVSARVVRAPAGFTVPFSTYVPEDMTVELQRSQAGESLRAAARFGGVPNEQAYLQVLIHPSGATLRSARDALLGFVRGRNPELHLTRSAQRYPWSEEEYTFRYPDGTGAWFTGHAALGRHGNRVFHVLTHYPAEYGDGIGPRIGVVLGEWRWEDTGSALGG